MLTPGSPTSLFFEVVRWNPDRMKRTRPQEDIGFSNTMVAIAPRRLLESRVGEDPLIASTTVDAQSNGTIGAQTLVLGLSSLSHSVIGGTLAYPASNQLLEYDLADDADIRLPPECQQHHTWPILRALLEAHTDGGVLFDSNSEDGDERGRVLEECVRVGLVAEPHAGNIKHMMTDKGLRSISTSVRLREPFRVDEPRPGRPLMELNVWERACTLNERGWRSCVATTVFMLCKEEKHRI